MQRNISSNWPVSRAMPRLANWFYGLMLYLYPRAFRRDYGALMAQLFRDRYRTAEQTGGTTAFVQLWLATIGDLSRTVLREHLAAWLHRDFEWGGLTMNYEETIREFAVNPEQLELTYQAAAKAGEREHFVAAIHAAHAEDRGNLLFAAWHYRLVHAAQRVIAWSWAVPLAILNGLILWWLSDDKRYALPIHNPFSGVEKQAGMPAVFLLGAAVAATMMILFLAGAGERKWLRALAIGLALGVVTVYAYLIYPQMGTTLYQEQYLSLMPLHLALLAWAGIGGYVLLGQWDARNRFAFLAKSLEFLIVGGLFGFMLMLFTGVTFGLFAALGIEPPENITRLFVVGGAGLIGVLAVALAIDPRATPQHQSFDEGLSRLIPLLLRLLLPLVVGVLAIFVLFIPANFWQPFENRDVLIAFNAMLFAVIALLVGVTPLAQGDLPAQRWVWLRRGILALAGLALVIGLYALAAILYRTFNDRLTPNRVAFIGWNLINIVLLGWLLLSQRRAVGGNQLPTFHRTLTGAMIPYALWALITVLILPWTFPINQGDVAGLPKDIQHLVGEEPYPILLKCYSSPHIYALDAGEKRWIKDIPTFEDEGFEWRDVHFESCADIDAIPDGPPIPLDAGVPPSE